MEFLTNRNLTVDPVNGTDLTKHPHTYLSYRYVQKTRSWPWLCWIYASVGFSIEFDLIRLYVKLNKFLFFFFFKEIVPLFPPQV